MLRKIAVAVLLALFVSASIGAHDLFLKLDSYFIPPNTIATVRLLNGTFSSSDGLVSRERFRDIEINGPSGQSEIGQRLKWRDEGKTTIMDIKTGESGTYLVAVSTKPREIDLKAEEFNSYLEHDGLPDTLAERKKRGQLNKDVRERYSKHSIAIFQVGEKLTDHYTQVPYYPVAIAPQQNPYALRVGQVINLLCTNDGQPLVNQFVMAGWESQDGKPHNLHGRTNSKGIVGFKLQGAGKWYVKFIHMTPLNEPNLNYESKWASITFEIR